MLKAVKILRLVKINVLLVGKLRKNENYSIVKHYKIKNSYPTKVTVMIKVWGNLKTLKLKPFAVETFLPAVVIVNINT